MELRYKIMLIYIIAVNAVSVVVCIYDKLSAKAGGWRVPESTLMWLSILGGSPAMYITMQIIRHKTLHAKFMIGLPAIFMLQLALVLYIYAKLT